ncbi:MAG: type II toxin-antitoxin system VapC family toxin [Acidobacteriota bacterium]|nr:type II toxin-antitoxin system VapC family toxin [Acidobacteriota bacterium]
MRSFIVDTDVVSFIYKGDTRGNLYENHLRVSLSSISFMTLAELNLWAESHNWGERRREELALFLQRFAVIESNQELCQRWAIVTDQVRRSGRKIQPGDAWIAATALLYGLPLVTHNAVDYAGIAGLTVISELDK